MLVLLLACAAPCPAPADVPVVDWVGDAGVVSQVEASVASFAAWTARDALCVSQIDVVEEIVEEDGDVAGRYAWSDRSILVEAGSLQPDRVTTHELCHALDREEGFANAHPNLFPAERTEESALYPDIPSRERETFAQACEGGALDLGFTAILEDACGEALISADRRFVHDEVYVAAPWSEPSLDGFTVTTGAPVELVLPASPGVAGITGDDDGLVLVFLEMAPRVATGITAYRPVVRRMSLVDGSLGPPLYPDLALWSDVSAKLFRRDDGGPPVVALIDGSGLPWLYEVGDTLNPVTTTSLPGIDRWSTGIVLDGVAWYTHPTSSGDMRPLGVRLADGVQVPAPDLSDWIGYLSVVDGADGTLLLWAYQRETYLHVDLARGEVTPVPVPFGWPVSGLLLDGERLLGRFRAPTTDHRTVLYGWVAYDLATGAWTVAEDPCGTEPVQAVLTAAGRRWAVSGSQDAELRYRFTPLHADF